MKKIKNILRFLSLAMLPFFLSGCGVGANYIDKAPSDVESNITEGATNIAVDVVISVTFTKAVDTSTVTTQTFFIQAAATADVSAPKLVGEKSQDVGTCDAASAVAATVACSSDTTCTLTPSANLSYSTNYVFCITQGIKYQDGNTYPGKTISFQTAAYPSYTIGGTISGLSGTVVLQDNGADDFTVSASGSFTFATKIADGETYAVTVLSHPSGQHCVVSSGTGTVSGADITSVVVTCRPSGETQWSNTVTKGGNKSYFYKVGVDSADNSYAVGYIYGTGAYNFGAGDDINGTFATGTNAVIVKYSSDGVVQWAKTVTEGAKASVFNAVFVDSAGNSYAVGYITDTGNYTFDSGVTANGQYSGSNAVIVKYDSNGVAKWAKTVTEGTSGSYFYGVSVDSTGNSYVSGFITDTGNFNFGSGVINGKYSVYNAVIVKYDSDGVAKWARTVSKGPNLSLFYGVSIDSSGNSYAGGYIYGTGDYNFGSDDIHGTSAVNNAVIVKYNNAGAVQWASTITEGSDISYFWDVSTDSDGNSYGVGRIKGVGNYNFGSGVVNGVNAGANALIVKYNSSGVAQWARTATAGGDQSYFYGVSLDSENNCYAAGGIAGSTGNFNFGSGVINGAYSGGSNAVIVKYSSSGAAQWAKTVSTAANASLFYSVSANTDGFPSVAGYIIGADNFNFGSGNIAGKYSTNNAVIVKYAP